MDSSQANEIRDIVREAIKEALEVSPTHVCRFAISDADAKEMGHLMGMVKDLGGGETNVGVEVMRDNHKRVSKTAKLSEKLGSVFFTLLMAGVITGALAALWQGVKTLAGKP